MPRLDPPTNVTATQGDPTVTVAWDAVDGAGSYQVWRSTVEGEQGYVIGMTDELELVDTTALLNVIYWYGVTARSTTSNGCSDLSEQAEGYIEGAPLPDPPLPPDGLLLVIISP